MQEDFIFDKIPSKHKQFIHELLFVFRPDFTKKIGALALGMVLAIGLVSITENIILLPSSIANLAEQMNLSGGKGVKLTEVLNSFSHSILSAPQDVYNVFDEISGFYAEKLSVVYLSLGTKINSYAGLAFEKSKIILENPPAYILGKLNEISMAEKKIIDDNLALVGNFIASANQSDSPLKSSRSRRR